MNTSISKRPPYIEQTLIDVESMMSFDGVDDYVLLSPNPAEFLNFTNTDSFSISFYTNKDTAFNTRIFSKEVAGVRSYFITISNNQFIFSILDDTSQKHFTVNDNTLLNTIKHYCITFEGNGVSASNIKMYINGILVHNVSQIIDNFITNTGFAYIARNSVNNARFQGLVSNFSVYNKVLSHNEVKSLHRWGGYIPQELHASCIAYYPLNNRYGHKRNLLNVITASTTTATNQVAHGFNVGDWIWDNGGTWQLSDFTNPSEPPTIVSAVTDVDNFTRATEGVLTITNHGFGSTGDLIYLNDNGTSPNYQVIPTDYLVGEVLDGDTIKVATGLTNVTVDEVERFNYAKTIPLKANHGEVFGYTDDEFGITPSLQETNYDFYDTSEFSIQSGIKPLDIGETDKRITIPNNAIFDFGTNDFFIEFDIVIPETLSIGLSRKIFAKRQGGGSPLVICYVANSGGNIQISMELRDDVLTTGAGVTVLFTTFEPYIVSPSLFTVRYNKLTADPNNFILEVFKDEQVIKGTYNVVPILGGFSNGTLTTTGVVNLLNDNVTNPASGLPVVLKRFKININNTDVEELHFNNNSGLTTTGRINGSVATTTTGAGRELIGGGLWLEEKSLMPEIKQGLGFKTTAPLNRIAIPDLNPPFTDGYTFLWEFYPTQQFFGTTDYTPVLFANDKIGGDQTMFMNNNNTTNPLTISNILSSSSSVNVPNNITNTGALNTKLTLLLRLTTGNDPLLYINGQKLGGNVNVSKVLQNLTPDIATQTYIFSDVIPNDDDVCKGILTRFALWNRALSDKEMIELSKFATNPTIAQQKNLQVYYPFQEGNLYFNNLDDGTDLFIRNLAPASQVIGGDPTIWDARLTGYSNIADARSNISTLHVIEERSENILAFTVEGSPSFDPSVTMNNGQTVVWDFGDGTTQQSNTPIKVYGNTVDYEIKMYGRLSSIVNLSMNADEIKGTLDLSKVQSTTYNINDNPLLTKILHGTTLKSTLVTSYNLFNCGLTGVLDLSVLNLSGIIQVLNNPNLTTILNPTNSNIFTIYSAYSCNLQSLDVSTLTGLGNDFRIFSNPNLTTLNLPTSSQVFTRFWTFNCKLTTLDFTTLTGLGGDVQLNNNSNLTSIDFSSSLDNLVNVDSNYSLKLINEAYVGNCIKLRKQVSTVDITQDFGFVGKILDWDGITSWASDADGGVIWVDTWYDQFGVKNLSQNILAEQPKLHLGKQAIHFDGTGFLKVDSILTFPLSAFSMYAEFEAITNEGTLFWANEVQVIMNGGILQSRFFDNTGITGSKTLNGVPPTLNVRQTVLWDFDGTNHYLNLSGNATFSNAYSGLAYNADLIPNTGWRFGKDEDGSGFYFEGYVWELGYTDNSNYANKQVFTNGLKVLKESPFTHLYAYGCNLSTLDLSTLINLGGDVRVYNNPNLTTLTNPTSNQVFTFYWAYNCNLGTLDLSGLTSLGGNIQLYNNPNLTSIVFPNTTQLISTLLIQQCGYSTIDLSPLSNLSNEIRVHTNTNLTNIILPSNSNTFLIFYVFNTNLGYIDFTSLSNMMEVNDSDVQLQNNNMTVGEINAILVDLDSISTGGFTGRTIDISGTNAAPDGGVNPAIAGVDQTGGAGSNFFSVATDLTAYFPTGTRFTVSGSTGNDGTYTVVSASFTVNTDIIVEEAIPDATVDGSITTADGSTAVTNLTGKGFTVTTS